MNNKEIPQENYATYHCIADSFENACVLRSLLSPWLLYWDVVEEYLVYDIDGHVPLQVEIVFSVSEGCPSYAQLLWLVDGIQGLEGIGTSMAPGSEVSYRRITREPFDEPARPPSKVDANAVCDALKAYKQGLYWQLETAIRQGVRLAEGEFQVEKRQIGSNRRK